MSKYYEDEEDLRYRLLIKYGPLSMDSLQLGDHIMLATEIDDMGQIRYDSIELRDILSSKKYEAAQNLVEHHAHELYDFKKIPRLFLVTNIVGGIPIIECVKFPKEHHPDDEKYSLAMLMNNFIEEVISYDASAAKTEEMVRSFVKVDSNYLDSVLLDSTFTPYEHDILRVKEFEIELDKKIKIAKKQQRAEAARERREYNAYWKEEFFTIVDGYLSKKFKGSL